MSTKRSNEGDEAVEEPLKKKRKLDPQQAENAQVPVRLYRTKAILTSEFNIPSSSRSNLLVDVPASVKSPDPARDISENTEGTVASEYKFELGTNNKHNADGAMKSRAHNLNRNVVRLTGPIDPDKNLVTRSPISPAHLHNLIPGNLSRDYPEYSICFPSISTAAYKFNLEKASTIGCQVIEEFLATHKDPRLRLYLVDFKESQTLEIFRKKAPADKRFSVRVASLTALKDDGIPCHYIVNASNPNFDAGGSGTNRAIHEACDDGSFRIFQIALFGGISSLESLTKRLYSPPAEVGVAYPVDLIPGMPIYDKQDVRTVIHVVGPNMCPKRVNCLNGDYEKGSLLLIQSYKSILEAFYAKTGLH